MQYEVLAHRLMGNRDLWFAALEKINAIDPLNHFTGFEKYLDSGSEKDFTSLIRNEFPEQTYLELSIFYHSSGLNTEALKLLEMAPSCPEVTYWRNYLDKPSSIPINRDLRFAPTSSSTSSPTKFSLPWRLETLHVIEQAESEHPDWRNRYYLGLIRWNLDDSVKARELFRSCKDEPVEAHFYLSRARLFDGADSELVLHDLERAVSLDPGDWRTWQALTSHHMKKRAWAQALQVSRRGTDHVPGHMIMEFDRAKAELYNHQYDRCLDILNNLNILPAEGAREGHDIYRSALILRALDYFRKQQYSRALKDLEDARQWPETLGVGKPYVTDERIEDYLAGLCYLQMNRPDESARCLNKVISWTENQNPPWGSPHLLAALSQVLLNREMEGDKILNNWMKVQPASPLMMWAVAAYSNNPLATGKALERLGWKPEETPWALGDGQLALVYEVVKKVKIK